jgi:allophanate hydrolase subunit 1
MLYVIKLGIDFSVGKMKEYETIIEYVMERSFIFLSMGFVNHGFAYLCVMEKTIYKRK